MNRLARGGRALEEDKESCQASLKESRADDVSFHCPMPNVESPKEDKLSLSPPSMTPPLPATLWLDDDNDDAVGTVWDLPNNGRLVNAASPVLPRLLYVRRDLVAALVDQPVVVCLEGSHS